MNNIRAFAGAAGIALVAAAAPAHAVNLIGETLTFHRLYPDAITPYGPPFSPTGVTVVAGPADNLSWLGTVVTVEPEATTIAFSINAAGGFIGAGTVFDGFAVSGFSFSPSMATITSNTTGRNVELSFGPNTVYLDFVDNYPNYTYLGTIVIGFPVPEPATWGLFAAGLAALGWRARKSRRG